MIPDIKARLSLASPEMGGRQSPTITPFYSFRVRIDMNFYDARVLLSDNEPLTPGEEREVTVKFLEPSSVMKKIRIGDVLPIWEMKQVGHLLVLDVIGQDL